LYLDPLSSFELERRTTSIGTWEKPFLFARSSCLHPPRFFSSLFPLQVNADCLFSPTNHCNLLKKLARRPSPGLFESSPPHGVPLRPVFSLSPLCTTTPPLLSIAPPNSLSHLSRYKPRRLFPPLAHLLFSEVILLPGSCFPQVLLFVTSWVAGHFCVRVLI